MKTRISLRVSPFLVLVVAVVLFVSWMGVGESAASSGTLTVAMARNIETLDPPVSVSVGNWSVSMTMFDPLINVTPDGKFVPALATSWQNVDPLTWKFNLRKGVKFHDGERFTSESVKYSLDRIVVPALKARQAGYWLAYDRTETPDEYTAIIKTKTPVANLLSILSVTMMVPPHAANPMEEKPVGTGPFKFVEWVVDDHLTVVANPDYWQGPPKVEKIVFRAIREATTRFSALLSGQVDMIDQVLPEQIDTVKKTAGLTVVKQPTSFIRQLWVKAGQPPFSDPRVRKALKYAIDTKTIIDSIMEGNAQPVDSCVARSVVGYVKQTPYPYDPQKAKALLAEAGYRNGFSTELKFTDMYAKHKEVVETIAAQLGQVGIKVKVSQRDQASWTPELTALQWEITLVGAASAALDGDDPTRRFWRSDSMYKGMLWTPPALDKLLLDEQAEVDPAKRLQVFDKICKTLYDDGPVVYIQNDVEIYGIRDRVTGFAPYPDQTFRLYPVGVK